MEESKKCYQFEFYSQEFNDFYNRIKVESNSMIRQLIYDHCPVSIGDIVQSRNAVYKTKITRIQPKIIDSYGYFGDQFSFYLWGIPVKKDGITAMKGRKEEGVDSFIRADGKHFKMPSYLAIGIKEADMRDL